MTTDEIVAQANRVRVFLTTRYYYGDISPEEYLIGMAEIRRWAETALSQAGK